MENQNDSLEKNNFALMFLIGIIIVTTLGFVVRFLLGG